MSYFSSLISLLEDFLSLLYPRLCAGCQTTLVRGEEVICLGCQADLPKTGFEKVADNPVSQLFWGRVEVQFATAFCSFDKGGVMQHFMHQLKYKGSKEVGEMLGKLFGNDLVRSKMFLEIDLIIPVPLHPKRERKRGYNQSTEIAKGVALVMAKPLIIGNLIRSYYSETQTNKGRFERWENVRALFIVKKPELLEGKHILLIDDVVTTGSTLEACAQALLRVPGVRVSIATLAYA
jgi:ComF family protein